MHHGTLNSLERRTLMRNNSCQPKHGKKKKNNPIPKSYRPEASFSSMEAEQRNDLKAVLKTAGQGSTAFSTNRPRQKAARDGHQL